MRTIKIDGNYYTKKTSKTPQELFTEFLMEISENGDHDYTKEIHPEIFETVEPELTLRLSMMFQFYSNEYDLLRDSYFNKDKDLFDVLDTLHDDMKSGKFIFSNKHEYPPRVEDFSNKGDIKLINQGFLKEMKLKGFKLVK